MIAKHDPYAAEMANAPDPYDAIERELAAEDERVGVWPSPQWWRDHAEKFNATDPTEYMKGCRCDAQPTVTVEFGLVEDCPGDDTDDPIVRDRHARRVDYGPPLTRKEAFWLAVHIGAAVVGLTLLGLWGAGWIGGAQ